MISPRVLLVLGALGCDGADAPLPASGVDGPVAQTRTAHLAVLRPFDTAPVRDLHGVVWYGSQGGTAEVDLPPDAVLSVGFVEVPREGEAPEGQGGAPRLLRDGRVAHTFGASRAGRPESVPLGPAGPATLSLELPGGVAAVDAVITRSIAEPDRIVLVVVDTLRADHLGFAGYPRPTSPRLDALAAAGAWWQDCLAVAPWTLPSTRALLSGRPHHASHDGPAMLERFSQAGWATGAILRNPWLSEANGFATGAATFDAAGPADAEDSTTRALDWLEAHTAVRPGVLVLHHLDPHLPYAAPVPAPPELDRAPVERPGLTAAQRDTIAAYDAEVRYTDGAIGRLWDGLKALPGRSLLVVTADHGEEFWEHGRTEHGHSLHAELLRVPLVVVGSGVSAQGVRSEPASLLDVAPTMLAWAGLPTEDLPGRDLLASTVADFPPLLIGETANGADAWGLAAHGETGLARYWIQGAREHLYASPDRTDAHNLAPAEAAPWRARLAETFGVAVKPGLSLQVSRAALAGAPAFETLTLASAVPVHAARSSAASNYATPSSVSLTVTEGTVTVHVDDALSAGVVVDMGGELPKQVELSVDNGPAEWVRVRADGRARVPHGDGQLRFRLRAGPTAWPGSDAPTRVPDATPGGDEPLLRELGYLD